MKKKNNIACLFFLVFTLIFLPFISSAPPVTTVQEFPEGYVIVEAQHPNLKLNENFTYNFFVYNTSTGNEIEGDDCNCTFYLANKDGEVLFSENATYSSYWYLEINGTLYLNESGFHSYGVNCQNGNGGSLAGNFLVTSSGTDIETNDAILSFIIIAFFIFLAIMFLIGFFRERKIQYKWSFLIIGFIFVLSALNLISIFATDFLINEKAITFLDGFTAISFILFWLSFGLLAVFWFITFLQELLFKKALKQLKKYGSAK